MTTTTTTSRVSPSHTCPNYGGLSVYDGYATIRARGLYRQRSIRAASKEAGAAQTESQEYATPRTRRRTLSLMSNCSQSSGSMGASENIYASTRPSAKHVPTPTVHDMEIETAYANASSLGLNFRPLSDDSSSSGAGSHVIGVGRDHGNDVSGTGNTTRKNFRFSLDSLHSNITPKTPDCEGTTEEEENENIFLYTAPKSPKRYMDSRLSPYYSPVARTSFEKSDHDGDTANSAIMRRRLERTPSSVSSHYKSPNVKTLMSNSYHCEDQRDNCHFYQSTGQLSSPTHIPPTAPVRRESLYATPYRFMSTPQHSPNNKRANAVPLELIPKEINNIKNKNLAISQRSSSVDMLERSQTSQSLATIDQDEILVVPTAMPVLQNAVDKRYHTLGHMRVQSLGSSLHRTYDFPHHYFNFMGNNSTQDLLARRSNKSAGNIYASADEAIAGLNRLAPEYVDPLDFKIGCQSTLRSKPVIPWYELAIRRDVKRQSLPAMNSSPIKKLNNNSLNNSHHSDDRCSIDGRQVNIIFISKIKVNLIKGENGESFKMKCL